MQRNLFELPEKLVRLRWLYQWIPAVEQYVLSGLPKGTYRTLDNTCVSCHSTCMECTVDKCTVCVSTMLSANGRCGLSAQREVVPTKATSVGPVPQAVLSVKTKALCSLHS